MRTPAPDADLTGRATDRLAALPRLFRDLMDRPLEPLTRARLPARSAVYVFYQGDEPVSVGSPPHVEERRILGSSVRLSLAASGRIEAGDGRLRMNVGPLRAAFPGERRRPIAARWLPLEDDEERLLLELYVAQSLGLSTSHPRIRGALNAPVRPDSPAEPC
jgi:hypothetical protein